MTDAGGRSRDILGTWCGGVLVLGAALTPLLAWLAPLGFAPLLAVMGLLSLPAIRLRNEDRPLAVVLLAGLLWAGISTTWSPFLPKHTEDSSALKLAFELPLYWSAVCGARRASPRLQRLALQVLAFGLAALGLLLLVEAYTGGEVYRRLHVAFYEPIRPDLAGKNLGETCFVLALLWPLAAAGARRSGAPGWLAVPMVAAVLVASVPFKADAPMLSVPLSILVGLAVLRWPRRGPLLFAGLAGVIYLTMPAIYMAVQETLRATGTTVDLPLSYAMRVGYWSHAMDWISLQPVRGWGLDSSRAFSPGIVLHPHNGPLQIWLELGALGALLAAAAWWLTLSRLSDDRSDLARAAIAGSAATYLLFSGVNFGVWQEWWLALAALVGVTAAALAGAKAQRTST
jgi:O-antigen ligase